MGADLEVAIVRACCSRAENQELYWMFSRSQLEFVLKELDVVDELTSKMEARYQDMLLPVLSLENYFGFLADTEKMNQKHMVLRAADENRNLRRLIVQSAHSPKFFNLTKSFISLDSFSVPQNSKHMCGAYSLGRGKVGLVPDVISICIEIS